MNPRLHGLCRGHFRLRLTGHNDSPLSWLFHVGHVALGDIIDAATLTLRGRGLPRSIGKSSRRPKCCVGATGSTNSTNELRDEVRPQPDALVMRPAHLD